MSALSFEAAHRPLTICKVWDSDYPWDVRAEKVSAALTAAEHDVHMVARNREARPLVEELPECTVHRLAPLPGMPRAVSRASMFPAFFNPRWSNLIQRVARDVGADLILCRDLPLAITSIRAARSLGIPCVMDMAEVYPAMLQSRWDTGRLGLTDHLVRSPRAAAWVERWSVQRMDGILVVVDEAGDYLVDRGVPADRIALVSNTPPLSRLDGPRARHDGELVDIVYLGLMEGQRGIGVLLDALAIVAREGLPFRLTLIGGGLDLKLFREQAARLSLGEDVVRFRGSVPNSQALQSIAEAQIGIVPHWADKSWNHTVPNKLFDYMAAGLAVVTSSAVPAARIVQSTGCGRVFRDRNAEDLARQLRTLQGREARVECAGNGRAAVANEHNWEADTRRMLDLIDEVVEQFRGRTPARISA